MVIEFLPKDTYLAMIQNSVHSNLFRNAYASVDGEKKDILRDGDLSCAFFVSSILNQFKLLKGGVHTTVSSTVRDMEESGWEKTEELAPGAVVVWVPQEQADGEVHAHIGFVFDAERAISTSYIQKTPVEHPIARAGNASSPERAIDAIYTHRFLQT